MGQFFEFAITQPILNILVAIYKLFLGAGLPYAFGFAILALTVLFRLIFQPFFRKQADTQVAMAALKPKLDELSRKYKDDKTRLSQAQMDLYKAHGVNPTSGCLFALLQIPVFIGFYQTLSQFVDAASSTKTITTINKLLYSPSLKISSLDPSFFIFNLAHAPNHYPILQYSNGSFKFLSQNVSYWPYLLVPIITGALQYLQAKKMALPQKPKDPTKKEASTSDDFQSALNTQMKYFFPIMIAWFSYTLPTGMSLYWNIFSIFSILTPTKKPAAADESPQKKIETNKSK